MKIRFILIAVCFLFSLPGQADEGMWMLGNLNKQTRQTMKELGLQMSVNKLYNTKRPSLKDAVVSFGGFCSGVVVSFGFLAVSLGFILAVRFPLNPLFTTFLRSSARTFVFFLIFAYR